MKDQALVDKMKRILPPLFLATQIDDLTQGIILWRTLQNLRSLDKHQKRSRFPEGTFSNCGKKKIIINRDLLLQWWQTTLTRG